MTARDRLQAAISRLDRARSGYPWIAAAVALVVGISVIDTLPVGVARDDGWYLILAKSLATGEGYRWINLPGAPPATHFPPGYPAFLALAWWLVPSFPANVLLFKALNACLLAATAGGLAVFAHRRLGFGRGASALLAVAACIGIPVLVLSTILMSEPLFLALLVPTLMAAERVVDGDRRATRIIAIGVLAGLATLIRSHGIVLIAAIACMLLVRRRTRDAVLATVTAVAIVLPWQLWVQMNQGAVPYVMRGAYESYGAWLADAVRTEGLSLIARTIPRTSTELAAMFATLGAPSWPAAVRVLVLFALTALFIIGGRRFWRSAPTTLLFIVLYVVIVLSFPFNPARYIWGIWPLVVLLAAAGAREIAMSSPQGVTARVARYALIASTLVVAVGYLRYNARGYRGKWWSSIARQQTRVAQPLVIWARTRTRPDEVIASGDEPLVYLYSGRRTVPATSSMHRYYFGSPSASEKEAGLRAILSSYRVDAVAVVGDDSLGVAARAMAARRPPELVLRDTFANGMVFAPVRR